MGVVVTIRSPRFRMGVVVTIRVSNFHQKSQLLSHYPHYTHYTPLYLTLTHPALGRDVQHVGGACVSAPPLPQDARLLYTEYDRNEGNNYLLVAAYLGLLHIISMVPYLLYKIKNKILIQIQKSDCCFL